MPAANDTVADGSSTSSPQGGDGWVLLDEWQEAGTSPKFYDYHAVFLRDSGQHTPAGSAAAEGGGGGGEKGSSPPSTSIAAALAASVTRAAARVGSLGACVLNVWYVLNRSTTAEQMKCIHTHMPFRPSTLISQGSFPSTPSSAASSASPSASPPPGWAAWHATVVPPSSSSTVSPTVMTNPEGAMGTEAEEGCEEEEMVVDGDGDGPSQTPPAPPAMGVRSAADGRRLFTTETSGGEAAAAGGVTKTAAVAVAMAASGAATAAAVGVSG